MPPGYRSDEISSLVMGGMANMQGQAAFAQSITPQNFGAPVQPMTAQQPTQSPFMSMANFAANIMGGMGAVTNQMPGTPGFNQAMESMQMQAMGAIASPSTPVLGQMFTGMQQQFGANRMMEQQFQFARPGGRGFTPTQQLQVGAGMQQLAAQTPFTGMEDITQMMQQGAQMGQFQGVRDVQSLMKKTREMLGQWRTIATELNTTLTEAGQISGQLKQMGIFRGGQQVQAIQQMAGMAAVTGIGVQQQIQMGAAGAQMAPRLFGQGVGVRAAGAQAMQAQVQMVGLAARTGVISEEQIFEATGQTGMAGQAAMAQRMNRGAAKFMRRGRGKVTLAAFVDPDTMNLDEDMIQRFMSGNMSSGEIQRRAGQNAAKMGHVRWRANRGRMAAAFTEETGGLGHLALMRSFMGEGVMEDTERSRQILSRKTGMSDADIDAMMPMLREMPMMQNRMRNETRMVARQREQAQRWNQYGPEAQMEKTKQKMRDAVVGPLESLRMDMQRAFTEAVTGVIDESAEANKQYVSESTRNLYRESITGGRGAQQQWQQALRGPGQEQLAEFRRGTAASAAAQEQFASGWLGLGGEGVTTISEKWARAVGKLRPAALAMAGEGGIGGFIGGQITKQFGAMPDVAGTGQLANAYNTGVFGKETLKKIGMSQGQFSTITKNNRVAQILVGGGDLRDKMDKVKDEFGLDSDEQARAVIAKVSRTENYVDAIEFLSPKERSSAQASSITETMKGYVDMVTKRDATGAGASIMRDQASQWLSDVGMQKMLAAGASPAEIMEYIGSDRPEQQAFLGLALNPTEELIQAEIERGKKAGERIDRGVAERRVGEQMRREVISAGTLARGAEALEFTRRRYAGQGEDIREARRAGGLEKIAAGKGAVGKLAAQYAGLFETYDLDKDEELREFNKEMDVVNNKMLALSPGDADSMVTLLRQGGLHTVANQIAYASGRKRDIMEGSVRGARRTRVEQILRGAAGAFGGKLAPGQVLKRMGEMTTEELVDLGIEKPEELKEQIGKIGSMGKEQLSELISKMEAELRSGEEAVIREKEAEDKQLKVDQKKTMFNIEHIARDVETMAKGDKQPLQVQVIGVEGKDKDEKTGAEKAGEG